MMTDPQRAQGFTLVEILVSLLILTVVGMIAASGLNFIVQSGGHVEYRQKILRDIQRTVMIMEQDLRQIKIPGPYPAGVAVMPAITVTDSYLQLACSTRFNPHLKQQDYSTRQVIYQLVDTHLIRYVTVPGRNLTHQVLLSEVRSVHFQMTPHDNPLSDPSLDSLRNKVISSGIIIDIKTEKYGNIRRIMPIAVNTAETDPSDPATFSS